MIGLGSIGQRHAGNLRTLLGDSADFIAYRVRRQVHLVSPPMGVGVSRGVEDQYSIRVYSNLEEALEEKPEVAFLCNPTSLHVPVALACIRGGCDVLIEKPLSDSVDGIDELVRIVAEKKRIAMVGYQLRFHPCLHKLSEIIRGGVLGNLLAVRATFGEYLPDWHPYEDYRKMYAARADLGGGVVLTQIHEFDYLYSLFGMPKRIFAIGGHWSDLEIDVEDTASALMECTIAGRSLPVQLYQDYLQSPPSRQCEVIGERGRAVMDLHALTVTVFTRGNATPDVHSFAGFVRNQLFLEESAHFLECVRTRKRPVVDLVEALQSLRMALAVKKSMETHEPVRLASVV
ncbi:MAG: Gfo/Idh/MocA family oxidoreductase [Terracidiphilus sp.]